MFLPWFYRLFLFPGCSSPNSRLHLSEKCRYLWKLIVFKVLSTNSIAVNIAGFTYRNHVQDIGHVYQSIFCTFRPKAIRRKMLEREGSVLKLWPWWFSKRYFKSVASLDYHCTSWPCPGMLKLGSDDGVHQVTAWATCTHTCSISSSWPVVVYTRQPNACRRTPEIAGLELEYWYTAKPKSGISVA